MKAILMIPGIALLAILNICSLANAGELYSYTVSTDMREIDIASEEISINDGVMQSTPGVPALGYKIVKLALPSGTRIAGFSVETSDPQVIWAGELDFIRGDIKTGNYPQDTAFVPNVLIYESNDAFPGQRAEILSSGNWGTIHLVDLAVYPIAYKPLSGNVLLYPEIIVHFDLMPDIDNGSAAIRNDSQAYEALADLIANKTDLPILASPGGPIPLVLGNIPAAEYIIITSAAIAPGFYPLLDWKNQKGMPTDLALIEDILAVIPGVDPAEQLRNYLIQVYSEGIRFVLLGGDEDILPVRYLYPGNVNGSVPALRHQQLSDLYFADLTGNWDVDHDGVWGESYNDEPDIYPELYVGRVPARNVEQAAVWSAKAILYEKNPGHGEPEYLTRALFVCADQMRDMNQHLVLSSMLPSNFTADYSRLAEEPSGNDPNPTQPLASTVINVMQEGWGFISNLNHGDFSWYSSKAPGYNAGNWSGVWGDTIPWNGCGRLKDLTTVNQPSVHYSISCDLAAYDFDKGIFFPGPYTSPYCFMESFLFEPGSGVAFLGNTRWGWVSASYNLEKKFITRAFTDTTSMLSLAEALSKIDYPNHRDLAYGHTLFGDPEMSLWLSVDGFLSITGSGLSASEYSDFAITCGGQPVSGAKVCLYMPGDILEVSYTDDQGAVHFDVVPENDGYMTVTATKRNYIPDQKTIAVGSPLPIDDEEIRLPEEPTLYQNYPNPFNPLTTIDFYNPIGAEIEIRIYDIGGRLVKNLVNDTYNAGFHSVVWNGDNDSNEKAASGVYFYKFIAGTTSGVKQMILLK